MSALSPAAGPRFPALSLSRAELRIGLRSAAFRILAAASFVLGWSAGAASGLGIGFSAYHAGEAGWRIFGFAAILWTAVAAARESQSGTAVLIYSKPQPTERIVLAKFAGVFGQVLVALAALFVGALAGRLVHGDGVAGASAYVLQYARVAGVLFFACSASYSLGLLAESPVAGAVVALYWIVNIAGKDFLAKAYFPAYVQNLPVYLLVGTSLLAAAMWFHRRSRRGTAPAALWVRLAAPLCMAAGIWLLLGQLRDGSDPMVRVDPALEQMEMQSIDPGRRAPGFLLPDQNGRLTSLSDFPGRVLLVAVWSPGDTESSYVISALERIHQRYGSRGVLPVAICVSEDASSVPTIARGESLTYPLVYDWGSHNAPKLAEASPLASAYHVGSPPLVVVTDRRRRVRRVMDGAAAYDAGSLEAAVRERLEEEPR